MNILMTGATGFVGSYILSDLLTSGHNVTIIKRVYSDTHRINQFEGNIKFINDIKDLDSSKNFDCIIHAATAYENEKYGGAGLISANISLPINLLDFAVNANCKKFINLSTFIAQFKTISPNRYALTKRQTEEWGAYYANNYSLNFINLILHQVFGDGDGKTKFIPWVIKEINNNVDSINFTEGEQERDFIHVVDVAKAVKLIAEEFDNNKSGFESFDVCSGRIMTVKKFVEMVKRIAGSDTKLNFGSKEYRKYEIMRLNPNPKLLTNFGWQPSVSLEEGITQMLKNI